MVILYMTILDYNQSFNVFVYNEFNILFLSGNFLWIVNKLIVVLMKINILQNVIHKYLNFCAILGKGVKAKDA